MEEVRIKIPSGRLRIQVAKCPKGCSLINPDKQFAGVAAISARVRLGGAEGMIHFNPRYGVFELESTLPLNKGDIVDLTCPHCDTTLAVKEVCRLCNVPMFGFNLIDGGEVRACPRVGCHNHNLTIMDLDAQFAEFYNEERRPKM
jgi:hypothetical protein